jgi:curli biogenesis system outer membrane secretion channel CsgG
MKRFVLVSVLLAVFGTAMFAQNAELPRLAVVEFTANISNEKTKADTVTVRNLVESQMVATGKYQVITRAEIDKLLENQQIAVSSISSDENIKKLKIMNIDYIVTGSVDAMGDSYAIAVKILDVSTGRFSYSADALMGGSANALYTGVRSLVSTFVKGIDSSEVVTAQKAAQVAAQQARVSTSSNTEIGIKVSTAIAGTLYCQEEEIATLWDNDEYTIPISKPGTYAVKMIFGNGTESSQSIVIRGRGIVEIHFKIYEIGEPGSAGGIVFYDKGNNNDGWRYLEAAPADLGNAEWGYYRSIVGGTSTEVGIGKQNTQRIASGSRAAQLCIQYRGGGMSDWFLPSKGELDLMYKNLKVKGLGGFSNNYYWSSSENYDDLNYIAWRQKFSDGFQSNYHKNNAYSVRAVRAF